MRSYSRVLGGCTSVTEVKEYVYCPVIPWIHKYLGYHTRPTPSMESGKEKADASYKSRVAEELGLPRPVRVEVPVKDCSLGVSGVVDIVAGKGPYTIVEVKVFPRRIERARHFKTQLMVYALLVWRNMGPVREAILYMGGKAHRYRVTSRDLEAARRALRGLQKVLESEEPPRARQNPAKCSYCWYRRVCPLQA